MTTWTGNERRKDITLEVLKEMREWFDQHEKKEDAKFEALQGEIKETRIQAEERHDEMLRRQEALTQSTLAVVNKQNATLEEIHKLFKAAFPDGDAEMHRRAHEAWIRKTEKEEEFWLDVKKKAVAAALIGVGAWIMVALWVAFLQGPK